MQIYRNNARELIEKQYSWKHVAHYVWKNIGLSMSNLLCVVTKPLQYINARNIIKPHFSISEKKTAFNY